MNFTSYKTGFVNAESSEQEYQTVATECGTVLTPAGRGVVFHPCGTGAYT